MFLIKQETVCQLLRMSGDHVVYKLFINTQEICCLFLSIEVVFHFFTINPETLSFGAMITKHIVNIIKNRKRLLAVQISRRDALVTQVIAYCLYLLPLDFI